MRLDDELLDEVRRHAAEKGMTLTAVLDQALREMLVRKKELVDRARVPLPLFGERVSNRGSTSTTEQLCSNS